MTADAIWIAEAEVVQLMDLGEAIAALEGALREEARGEAQNMTKTLLQYGITGERKGSPATDGRSCCAAGSMPGTSNSTAGVRPTAPLGSRS